MIPADLLSRLQEADPEIFSKFRYTEIATYIEYDDFGNTENYIYQEDLIEPAQEAWLQACLQTAIRARKWLATVHAKSDESNHRCLARLDSEDDEIETVVEYGSTEAEALCLAYLEAIEAVKG